MPKCGVIDIGAAERQLQTTGKLTFAESNRGGERESQKEQGQRIETVRALRAQAHGANPDCTGRRGRVHPGEDRGAQLNHDYSEVCPPTGGRNRTGLCSIGFNKYQHVRHRGKFSGGHKIGHRREQPKIRFSATCWCERGDSNPHGFTRQILSLVRLPIPPLSHGPASTVYTDRQTSWIDDRRWSLWRNSEGCGKGTHPFCCAECPLSSSSVLRSFMNTRRTYSFHVVRGSVTG